MNPFLNCCLWYCSGVMIVGIAFFAVLLIMLATESRYLKPDDGYTYSDHMKAVGYAMIINAICAIICCGVICFSRRGGNAQIDLRDKPVFEAYDDDDD